MNDLLTVKEAAARLHSSEATVRRMLADGQLSEVRVRRKILIPISAIEAAACPTIRPALSSTAAPGPSITSAAVSARVARAARRLSKF
jgi:excisionase family DNA binding protein